MIGAISELRKTEVLQLLVLLACASIFAGCQVGPEIKVKNSNLTYPDSPKGEMVDMYHGTAVADPYRWLETLDSVETQDWIESQNRVSKTYLESLPARDYFADRLQELLQVPPPGAVRKNGPFWVSRQDGPGSSYRYLIQDDLDSPTRLLLDPETLALGADEYINAVRVSPDGRYAAYTVSSGGEDLVELRVRNLVEGRDIADRIPGLKFSMPYWSADSRALVYWRYRVLGNESEDGVDRDSYVAYHVLGTPLNQDILLVESETEDLGATSWSQLSDDGRFLVVFDDFGFKQKISVLDFVDPLGPRLDNPLIELNDKRDGDYTFAGNIGSTLYFRSSRGAPNGRIVAVRMNEPLNWTIVVPETSNLLQHSLVVGGHLVAAYREDVQSSLVIFEANGDKVRHIPLPAPGSAFWYSGTSDAPILTFFFDAYAHPRTAYRHHIETGETSILASPANSFDVADYVSRQIFYTSQDGTKVPLFITHRADLEPDGDTPTILHGYGASGAVTDPIFLDDMFAWVEAGGIFAVANIRGGGEYGEAWHQAGMLAKKQNTYDDFIAAAEYLIADGYTSPANLAILGYSNGGMLVGAAMTQRPDLFAAAVPVVGVLDALRFPSFTAGPRWARDMGDPAVEEQFNWLQAWSPLHKLKDDSCYPATLVATATNDDLVHPSQSYKYAARLQEVQSCDRPTILRAYALGGHRFWADQEHRNTNADLLAFIAQQTGLKVPGRSSTH